MRGLALHWKILIGLVLGIIWAIASSALGFRQFTIDWIDPFGEIFINLLKLIAVPLVLFSIIKGISDLSDSTKLGRLGLKTLVVYLLTTVSAVIIGLLLVNLIQPGTYIAEDQRITNRISYELWVGQTPGVEILDQINIKDDPRYTARVLEAQEMLKLTEQSESYNSRKGTAQETMESSPLQFLVDMVPSNIFASLNNNTLMLQVIFFALLFGITIILLPEEKVITVIHFVEGANEIFLKMVDIVMAGAPFFVFALLAGTVF